MVKKEILTVEDNSAMGYLLSTVLKKDYSVTRAASCADAINYLKSSAEKDLIILDIPDENSDNYQFLEHIASSAVLSNINTIVLSNSSDEEFKSKTTKLGASLFVSKPFDPVYLSYQIGNITSKSGAKTRKRKISFNLNIF
ncbi:MAG: response regulator [Niastella sp.]|nr:response regulator [Niastella sp.]